jgi:hypothetical protein
MPDECPTSGARGAQLREVLLGYLQSAGWAANCPGADGLTIEDVLDAYPKAVAEGIVPDWQQLLCRHPELEAELSVWMAAKDRWRFAVRHDSRSQPRSAGEKDSQ